MNAQGDQKSSKTNYSWTKNISAHWWSLGALGRVSALRPSFQACRAWPRQWRTRLIWGEIKIKGQVAHVWTYNHHHQHNNTSARVKPWPLQWVLRMIIYQAKPVVDGSKTFKPTDRVWRPLGGSRHRDPLPKHALPMTNKPHLRRNKNKNSSNSNVNLQSSPPAQQHKCKN
jgi:hypothetical protein